MYAKVLFSLLLIGGVCFVNSNKKILWNSEIDFLLSLFQIGGKAANLSYADFYDFNANGISIKGVKIGLLYSVQRSSDVYMEMETTDNQKIDGIFSIKNFHVQVKNVRFLEYSGPANFTANKNGLALSYTIVNKSKPRSCRTDWHKFEVQPFKQLLMMSDNKSYNNKDITQAINKDFLPYLNRYFEKNEFKKILSKQWDFCSSKFF